jgi:heat shock protein HslJ
MLARARTPFHDCLSRLAVAGLLMLAAAGCSTPNTPAAPGARGYLDAEYMIAGETVRLVNGLAETPMPGSSARVVTRYFGNELRHDVDGDGREDVVFLLTRETGGSGTFFFVVAALQRPEGWVGSQGILLGDRIAPQTIQPGPGTQVIVNFADRAPGEPFTTPPSHGRSLRLRFDPLAMDFGIVAEDYPGAADPARMTLGMHRWSWIGYTDENGAEHMLPDPSPFTLDFQDQGRFDATTDCNRMTGRYVTEGNTLSFGDMAATRMYCEGSLETLFVSMLKEVDTYRFTGRGRLVMTFRGRSGSMTFR